MNKRRQKKAEKKYFEALKKALTSKSFTDKMYTVFYDDRDWSRAYEALLGMGVETREV